MADGHFGHQRTFIARIFEPKRAELRKGPPVVESSRTPDDGLTLIVLDDVKRYGASTRASLIDFLSGEYGADARAARARPAPLAGTHQRFRRRRCEPEVRPCSSTC